MIWPRKNRRNGKPSSLQGELAKTWRAQDAWPGATIQQPPPPPRPELQGETAPGGTVNTLHPAPPSQLGTELHGPRNREQTCLHGWAIPFLWDTESPVLSGEPPSTILTTKPVFQVWRVPECSSQARNLEVTSFFALNVSFLQAAEVLHSK